MKTLFMTKGLPASGKTTWAMEQLKKLGNAKRANKDELRATVDGGRHSSENEKFVLGIRDTILSSALVAGFHAISDDTNLAPKHEARLRQIAQQTGAAFEIVDFTNVELDECLARDKKRQKYVGEKVIRDMYNQFLAPPATPPEIDPRLPWCIIVDVDGTVAKMTGRKPFEWHRVEEDEPRMEVWNAIIGIRAAHNDKIIFVSGRDSVCRIGTERWIYSRLMTKPDVYMRPEGDNRKDYVVKRELYEKYIKGQWNVRAIFDDRPQVIQLWRELGFADRLFDVGQGKDF